MVGSKQSRTDVRPETCSDSLYSSGLWIATWRCKTKPRLTLPPAAPAETTRGTQNEGQAVANPARAEQRSGPPLGEQATPGPAPRPASQILKAAKMGFSSDLFLHERTGKAHQNAPQQEAAGRE